MTEYLIQIIGIPTAIFIMYLGTRNLKKIPEPNTN